MQHLVVPIKRVQILVRPTIGKWMSAFCPDRIFSLFCAVQMVEAYVYCTALTARSDFAHTSQRFTDPTVSLTAVGRSCQRIVGYPDHRSWGNALQKRLWGWELKKAKVLISKSHSSQSCHCLAQVRSQSYLHYTPLALPVQQRTWVSINQVSCSVGLPQSHLANEYLL
jgi:hypothetical protein